LRVLGARRGCHRGHARGGARRVRIHARMSTAPSVVLFDLDGVLAHYAHAPRLERLARRCGARVEEVAAALFESGLEHDADLGVYDAAGQVDALARRLGRPVSLEDCIDARRAAMRVDPDML